MTDRAEKAFAGSVALALIAYGSYLIYAPAGFIAPGVLLWLDAYTWSVKQ